MNSDVAQIPPIPIICTFLICTFSICTFCLALNILGGFFPDYLGGGFYVHFHFLYLKSAKQIPDRILNMVIVLICEIGIMQWMISETWKQISDLCPSSSDDAVEKLLPNSLWRVT